MQLLFSSTTPNSRTWHHVVATTTALMMMMTIMQQSQFTATGLSMPQPQATATTAARRDDLQKPYGTADINYSAANEYLDEQYQDKIPNPYWPQTQTHEPVYNGREGVVMYKNKNNKNDAASLVDPALETCGFCLRHLPAPDVRDWNHKQQLRDSYLPVLRKFFRDTYDGSDENSHNNDGKEKNNVKSKIRHLLFYNPMTRGEDLDAQKSDLTSHELPTSPTQTMAHMDNDWNASNLDRVVGLVEKQSLDYYDDKDSKEFPAEQLRQDIQNGYRYMIVNCWRNAGETPIQRAPLGVYATHYKDPEKDAFPMARPDLERSAWYVYPEMTPDECLLFKQFDRDDRFVSDIWHCALHSLSKSDDEARRKSFDVRAFLVLDEKVSNEHDRYGSNRLEPKYKTAEEHQAGTS